MISISKSQFEVYKIMKKALELLGNSLFKKYKIYGENFNDLNKKCCYTD
jgi:hypothetical protein